MPPVLIYQMGKVGSSTVHASLNQLGIPNYEVHLLSSDTILETEEYYRQLPHTAMPGHLQTSKYLSELIEKTRGKIRWKVVTLVREPVSRVISNTYENLGDVMPDIVDYTAEESISNILEYICKLIRNFDESSDYVCTWFDREIKAVFGFDIYSAEYNKFNGYQIFRTDIADILLMRLESMNQCHKQAFYELLGTKEFQLINANIGREKPYRMSYKRLLHEISFPMQDLDRIYSSRYAKHFYGANEIKDLKDKWSEK
jgi:hypothetical protein